MGLKYGEVLSHLLPKQSVRAGFLSLWEFLVRGNGQRGHGYIHLASSISPGDEDHDPAGAHKWPALPVAIHLLDGEPGIV